MIKVMKGSLATALTFLTLFTSNSCAFFKNGTFKSGEPVSENNDHGCTSTETLAVSNTKRTYSNVPSVGIKNFYSWGCSMQCFVNATLQVLFSCPEFVNYVRNVENETLIDDPQDGGVEQHKVDILISNLKAILAKMENSNGKAIDVYNEVNEIREYFANGRDRSGDARTLFINILLLLVKCREFKGRSLCNDFLKTQKLDYVTIYCPDAKSLPQYINDENNNRNIGFDSNMFVILNNNPNYQGENVLVENINVDGKDYKLTAFLCMNSGHAKACVATQDGNYVILNDGDVTNYDNLADVCKDLDRSKFYASIAYYREV